MSTGNTPNHHFYALRLRHMLTKEILWIPPDTSMSQVIAHISNPLCSNVDCPNQEKSNSVNVQVQTKKTSSSSSLLPSSSSSASQNKTNILHSNSVWKAELRIRYIPCNLKELYERDRNSCHFYFNQVSFIG